MCDIYLWFGYCVLVKVFSDIGVWCLWFLLLNLKFDFLYVSFFMVGIWELLFFVRNFYF